MVAIGIIAGCGIVISYLLVRLYRQKKEIYDFTEELQRCLTLMKAGEDIENEAEFKAAFGIRFIRICRSLWMFGTGRTDRAIRKKNR